MIDMTDAHTEPSEEEIVNVMTMSFLDRMQRPGLSVEDAVKCAYMVLQLREIKRAPITMVFDDGEGSKAIEALLGEEAT